MHKKWSNWALNDFQKCGHYFYEKHIRKNRKPSGPAAVRGRSVHSQAQASFGKKMAQGIGFQKEEARDFTADMFEKKWDEGVRLDKEEIAELGSEGEVKGRYKDESVNLSGHHAVKLAPVINPIAVERKVIVKPKGHDWQVSVIMDLVEERDTPIPITTFEEANAFTVSQEVDGDDAPEWPTEKQEVVRDLKTTRKAPKKDLAESSQQLTFQALGRMAETGSMPDELGLDVLYQTPKTGQLKDTYLVAHRDKEDINVLMHRVDIAFEAVARGTFMPAPPDHWFCSPRWCEYWDECPYVRKPVQIQV